MSVKSIQKLSSDEKEVKLMINELKNVLTDIPYDFIYDNIEDSENGRDSEDDEEYYD